MRILYVPYNSIVIKWRNFLFIVSCPLPRVLAEYISHALEDMDGYAQTRQIALSSPCDPRRYPLRKYLSIPRPYTLEIIWEVQFVSSDFINILIKPPTRLFRHAHEPNAKQSCRAPSIICRIQ